MLRASPFLILALLGATLAVAESDEKYKSAIGSLQGLATIIGLGLLVFVSVTIMRHPEKLFRVDTLIVLALPFVLSVWTVPFGYIITLIGGYEQLFINLRIGHDQPHDLRFYSMLKFAELGHVNASKIRRMDKLMATRATWAKSHDELDNLYENLQQTLSDSDNKESRGFIWPEPNLLSGEVRYISVAGYLKEMPWTSPRSG